MKSRQDQSIHKPFRHLRTLLENKRLLLAPPPESKPALQPPLTGKQEDALFIRAMGDVTPLSHNRHWRLPRRRLTYESWENHEEQECVAALRRLIETGQGFVVAQTDEYMEAGRPGVDPRIPQRLHQGRYAIQDHIDLHGLFAKEAEPILRDFIRHSVQRACQAVLIIHGRGLKSPEKPVLKAKVFQWLTRNPLRAHVIALASARACDGGAGATYVLLRRRPVPRRPHKVKSKAPHP